MSAAKRKPKPQGVPMIDLPVQVRPLKKAILRD